MEGPSRKQQIYLEVLEALLPYARNVQTWKPWKRAFVNLYPELELVHNLPPLLRVPHITEFDVYWLNTQARNYANACARPRASSERILGLLREAVALVPSQLQAKLTWHG